MSILRKADDGETMVYLILMSGDDEGRKFEITKDETVIGRSAATEIHLDDPSASGKHCMVLRQGERYTIRDLKSTNGTRLNGVGIREARLKPKDIIMVGSFELMLDGEDIEIETVDEDIEAIPTTVRISSVGRLGGGKEGFTVRKDKRIAWVIVTVALCILALAALGFFVLKLTSSGS